MGGAASRRKGHNFERFIARMVREAIPDSEAKRGLQYRDGAEAPDVLLDGYHIECKRMKRCNLRGAFRQAVEANGDRSNAPVAVCKDDRDEPLAVMRFADWLELVTENWELSRR